MKQRYLIRTLRGHVRCALETAQHAGDMIASMGPLVSAEGWFVEDTASPGPFRYTVFRRDQGLPGWVGTPCVDLNEVSRLLPA